MVPLILEGIRTRATIRNFHSLCGIGTIAATGAANLKFEQPCFKSGCEHAGRAFRDHGRMITP
jgi:hypothetical protein